MIKQNFISLVFIWFFCILKAAFGEVYAKKTHLTCKDLLKNLNHLPLPPDASVSLVCQQASLHCVALKVLLSQMKGAIDPGIKTKIMKILEHVQINQVFWLTACIAGYEAFKDPNFSLEKKINSMDALQESFDKSPPTCSDLLGKSNNLGISFNPSISLVRQQTWLQCAALRFLNFQKNKQENVKKKEKFDKMISQAELNSKFWLYACFAGYKNAKKSGFAVPDGFSNFSIEQKLSKKNLTCSDLLSQYQQNGVSFSMNSAASLIQEHALTYCLALQFLSESVQKNIDPNIKKTILKLLDHIRMNKVFWLTSCMASREAFKDPNFSVSES